MPITKSAVKAVRSSLRKKVLNDRRKHAMKDIIKQIEKSTKASKPEAFKMLPAAFATIDKAVKRGVIKKNTAARKKSRLSRIVR